MTRLLRGGRRHCTRPRAADPARLLACGAARVSKRSCARARARASPPAKLALHEDLWFGLDKAGHFLACGGVTAGVWALSGSQHCRGAPDDAAAKPPSNRVRLVLALFAGLAVGAAKEGLDAAGVRHTHKKRGAPQHATSLACAHGGARAVSQPARPTQLWPTGGVPSSRDFAADAAGVAVACWMIAAYIRAGQSYQPCWRRRPAQPRAVNGAQLVEV